MKIILLTGAAGAGKDTAAAALAFAGYSQGAFADLLRWEVETAWHLYAKVENPMNISTEGSMHWFHSIENSSVDSALLEIIYGLLRQIKTRDEIYDSPKPPYIRRLLQLWGTAYRRNSFGQDYWVRSLQEKIRLLPETAKITISDCRFENEFAAFPEAKILVILKDFIRGGFPDNLDPTHESEQAWKKLWSYNKAESIRNTTPTQFLKDLKKWLDKIEKEN